jgi:lipopolysaccharide transport system permease protein
VPRASAEAVTRTEAGTLPELPRQRRPGLLRQLRFYRDLTLHLARRDFSLKTRGSLLGWFWSLAPVFLMLLVLQFLFTRVIPLNVPNFPLFILSGLLPWYWFAGSLGSAATSLEQQRMLVLRPGFPTILLPVAAVLVPLLDYLLALPILLIALAFTSGVPLEALFVPVLILVELVLAAGLAILISPFQLFYRDVARLVSLVMTVGFWVTPIFYGLRRIPERFQAIYKVNPMAHVIEAQRDVLIEGRMPPALPIGLTALAAVVILVIGCTVFMSLRDALPDRL